MKKMIFIFAVVVGLSARADAYQIVNEVVTSSATSTGVKCTSGTAVQLDPTTLNLGDGYNRMGARLVNQNATYEVYIGFDNRVTTSTVASDTKTYLGEKVMPNASAPYPLGKTVPIWCKAPDAAGVNGVVLSLMQLWAK